MRTIKKSRRGGESGMAMMAALVVIAVIASMAGLLMRVEVANQGEVESERARVRSLFAAEAGINARFAELVASESQGFQGNPPAVDVLVSEELHGVPYDTLITEKTDAAGNVLALSIQATGRDGRSERAVEAMVVPNGGGVFSHALFAGNEDGDPYALEFGGTGGQADEINGDVFSGGDVDVGGDATVNGNIQAAGDIFGATGEEGASSPVPDIAAMNYEVNHDIDVAAHFAAGTATYQSDGAGGKAWQLPQADEAHIFRLNPTDRRDENLSTTKDDYYLEDPYEPVTADSGSNGSNAYAITLSGQDGNPGPDGSRLVYFIDGNLWVHNKKTFSFKFKHLQNENARVTFVVKGNVYFSDNIFLQDATMDGIAFIAIEDQNEQDSGNIYFGDPEFGTLEAMAAFMYAENNFYDYNLDAAGSADVTLTGTMSAGNQVDINRDYGSQHSKLTIDFDDRVSTGALVLPGLPGTFTGGSGYTLASWREIPVN